MSFFDSLVKVAQNQYAGKLADGNEADVTEFIDTGSYSLNAALSGSIYGGLPANKVTALAGEASTGKTFYALNVVKSFLDANPDGACFYFESESAVTTEMFQSRGIDISRVFIIPVVTIEEFRTQSIRIIDAYLEQKEKDRKPMFMVLDSLGMLSTSKEVGDITEGKDTRDMTRAPLIRGAFRVLTLKLGRAKVALLLTNHTYDVIGAYMPTKEMGGGSGLKYSASSIIYLSKSKNRDATTKEVTGAIIKATINKSRLTIENKVVATLLDYEKGLNRYYGLLDIAEAHNIVKKVSNKYEFPGGVTAFEKAVYNNPEKYFTKDLLDKIDAVCKEEFLYGTMNKVPVAEEGVE